MKKLVFATNNKHKLEEVKSIIGSQIELLSLSDIDCHEEIPETADTIVENAIMKARYIKDHYGYDCFADDTGLEIEALDNEPGVYSARYAGLDCIAENNMNKVLKKMDNITNRTACFKTVIALIYENNTYTFEGKIKGEITTEKHGLSGFGYDPIFKPSGYELTFAELGDNVKNKISHRALATKQLIQFIKDKL